LKGLRFILWQGEGRWKGNLKLILGVEPEFGEEKRPCEERGGVAERGEKGTSDKG